MGIKTLPWERSPLNVSNPLLGYQGKIVTSQNLGYYCEVLQMSYANSAYSLESLQTSVDEVYGAAYNVCNLLCNGSSAIGLGDYEAPLLTTAKSRNVLLKGNKVFKNFILEVIEFLDSRMWCTIPFPSDFSHWNDELVSLEENPQLWDICLPSVSLGTLVYGEVEEVQDVIVALRRDIEEYLNLFRR